MTVPLIPVGPTGPAGPAGPAGPSGPGGPGSPFGAACSPQAESENASIESTTNQRTRMTGHPARLPIRKATLADRSHIAVGAPLLVRFHGYKSKSHRAQ